MGKHKFFKEHGDWFIHCPITGGSFSPDVWRTEKIPNKSCPCCGCDISVELRSQKTRKEIKSGNQATL